jgi:hypothetical protein
MLSGRILAEPTQPVLSPEDAALAREAKTAETRLKNAQAEMMELDILEKKQKLGVLRAV